MKPPAERAPVALLRRVRNRPSPDGYHRGDGRTWASKSAKRFGKALSAIARRSRAISVVGRRKPPTAGTFTLHDLLRPLCRVETDVELDGRVLQSDQRDHAIGGRTHERCGRMPRLRHGGSCRAAGWNRKRQPASSHQLSVAYCSLNVRMPSIERRFFFAWTPSPRNGEGETTADLTPRCSLLSCSYPE